MLTRIKFSGDTEDGKEQREKDDHLVKKPNQTEHECTDNKVNPEIRLVVVFYLFRNSHRNRSLLYMININDNF